MSFQVRDGDKVITVNTPCGECDLDFKGGAMKSGKELAKIGWHVHKTSGNPGGHFVFIDDALVDKYDEMYPGGPIQQLVEAAEKEDEK